MLEDDYCCYWIFNFAQKSFLLWSKEKWIPGIPFPVWRNFKIFFTIIFRPKFLFLDSVSILRLKTMVVLHILKHSKIVSDMAFFMIVCIRGTSNLHRYIYVVCISWMSTKTLSNHSNLTAMFEFHDFFFLLAILGRSACRWGPCWHRLHIMDVPLSRIGN